MKQGKLLKDYARLSLEGRQLIEKVSPSLSRPLSEVDDLGVGSWIATMLCSRRSNKLSNKISSKLSNDLERPHPA